MTGDTEVEIKIRLQDCAAARERIRAAGFSETEARQFETNTLYDTNDHQLRKSQTLLRLRQIGPKGVITWKGPTIAGPHKSRPELETRIDSIEILGRILGQLGFAPTFRYEKFRTEFVDGADLRGTVTLDETPIGNFLELEGPGEWIDDTAKRLGFSSGDYILESYGRLYLADCERRGVEPANMVFPS